MSEGKKRNIIIGSLCAVLLLMVVGYAAFNSVLKIKGTSSISSNWDIKITEITEGTKIGSATTTVDESGNKKISGVGTLTASVEADLVSPGDSIEYDITVTNAGSLNAKLEKITLSESNNPAIKFETSGLTEGETLTANGGTATLKLKITYDSNVTSQPENTKGTISVTLDYVQADGNGTVTPSESTAAEKLIETAVTTGDGLYADEYEEGRYVYKGANPNNYITFNNETWRILSVENDGSLKIMKKDSIGNMAFDSSNSNNWARPAPLNTYLNNDYYNSLNSDAQNLIQAHTWGVGPVTYNNTDLAGQIASENGTTWSGNIGLMSASEALRANTNIEQCGNLSLNNTNYSTCKTTNYIVPTTEYLWTISPNADYSNYVFYVYSYGRVRTNLASNRDTGVVPAVYLKSNINLEGEGTETNPYTIVS